VREARINGQAPDPSIRWLYRRDGGRDGAQDQRPGDRQVVRELDAVTGEHAALACAAFRRFGRGRHVAGLNLGDCFAYTLAKASGEPLVFKGGRTEQDGHRRGRIIRWGGELSRFAARKIYGEMGWYS